MGKQGSSVVDMPHSKCSGEGIRVSARIVRIRIAELQELHGLRASVAFHGSGWEATYENIGPRVSHEKQAPLLSPRRGGCD